MVHSFAGMAMEHGLLTKNKKADEQRSPAFE